MFLRKQSVLFLFVLLTTGLFTATAEARIGGGPVSFTRADILERGVFEVGFGVRYGSGADVKLQGSADGFTTLQEIEGDYSRVDATIGVSYGLSDRWELGMAIPYTTLSASWDRPANVQNPRFRIQNEKTTYSFDNSGLGDVEVYGTYVIMPESSSGGMTFSTRMYIAGGGGDLGVNHATGEFGGGLEFMFSQGMWNGLIHGVLGYQFNGGPFDNIFNYGFGYEYPLNDRSSVSGEVYGEQNVYPGLKSITEITIGYTRAFSQSWDLQLGGSFGVSNGGPDYAVTVGWHKLFGQRPRPAATPSAPPPPSGTRPSPPSGTGSGSASGITPAPSPTPTPPPVDNYRQAEALVRQGDTYLRQGLYLDAVLSYSQAVDLDPLNDRAYNNMGNAYYGLGQYEAARGAYEKAIAINRTDSNTHYNLGLTYYKLGDGRSAYDEFRRAAQLDPNNTSAVNNAEALRAYVGQ